MNLIKSASELKAHDFSKAVRTDKMVSAAGNVFAIKLHVSEEEEKELVRRINSALPEDIIIVAYAKVDDSFNARTDCKSRHYRYFFFKEDLNIEKMEEAAQKFFGKHDFRRFCKMQPQYEETGTVRDIFISTIVDLKNNSDFLPMAYYDCKGSGFLWHQVG